MSETQNQTTNEVHGVADLAAELQKMKRRKIWWWQRDDNLKARMSTTVLAAILLGIVLSICNTLVVTLAPPLLELTRRRSCSRSHKAPHGPRNSYRRDHARDPRYPLFLSRSYSPVYGRLTPPAVFYAQSITI